MQRTTSTESRPLSGETFNAWRARVAREQAEQAHRNAFASAILDGGALLAHNGTRVGSPLTLRKGLVR